MDRRGTVIEVRPKGLFRVRLETGNIVLCGLSPVGRHAMNRLIIGDQVIVKLSLKDPQRGQVLRKAESPYPTE